MKKIVYLTLAVSLCGIILYRGRTPVTQQPNHVQIAILTPTTHIALEEIESGFRETIQETELPLIITTYNANGNKTLLRAQAEEIVQYGYDLIVTIGALTSQTVAQLLHKKGLNTPHIFCGIDDSELAQSMARMNKSTTGVYVDIDYENEIKLLYKYKPHAKEILLVYDPTQGTGLEKHKKNIEQYVKAFNGTLHAVEIYHTNEIQQKIAALLPQMDTLLILVDNTVVSAIDTLINLCNRYGVTLVASDLSSGKKGAALAYGITEYDSGFYAAEQAKKILIDHITPAELPVEAISSFRIEINETTKDQQKLTH